MAELDVLDVVEICAGAGGQALGLERAGFEHALAVELDGAAYHGAPRQRERDLRRDAALARLGIVTVRYGHPTLFHEPDAVREEVRSVLETRRRQLGGRTA